MSVSGSGKWEGLSLSWLVYMTQFTLEKDCSSWVRCNQVNPYKIIVESSWVLKQSFKEREDYS